MSPEAGKLSVEEEVLMDAAAVVRELWTRFQARDWAGASELVAVSYTHLTLPTN